MAETIGEMVYRLVGDASSFERMIAAAESVAVAAESALAQLTARNNAAVAALHRFSGAQGVVAAATATATAAVAQNGAAVAVAAGQATAGAGAVVAANTTATAATVRLTAAQGTAVAAIAATGAAATKAATSMRDFGLGMERVGSRIQSAGRSLTTYVTLPITAMGAVSAKSFLDFDHAMTKSLSVLGDVAPALRQEMEQTARQMSVDSVTSAVDLANAYGALASAGHDAERSQMALSVVNDFAIAGSFDLAKATDLLAKAQNSLGMRSADAKTEMANMTRISDMLVGANLLASGTTEEFAVALTTKSGAAARQLNMSLEETVAILAVFANQGASGAAGGEKMAIVLRDLQASLFRQPKAWKAFGLEIYDANQKMHRVPDILQMLEGRFGKLTDAQKRAAAGLLGFQDRSFAALQQLIGTSREMKTFIDRLEEMDGKTRDVAEKRMASLQAQLSILKNRVVEVAIEIGERLVPVLEKLMEWTQGLINAWHGLSDGGKTAILVIGGMIAVIGPLLLMIGSLVLFVGSLIFIWSAVGAAVLAFAGNVALVTIAVGGTVAAILVTVAALAILADATLQMTNQGNLGILDYVRTLRWGGFQIETYWKTITAGIYASGRNLWRDLSIRAVIFEHRIRNIMGYVYRLHVETFRALFASYITLMDAMSNNNFSKMFSGTIMSVYTTFDRALADSYQNALTRTHEMMQRISDLQARAARDIGTRVAGAFHSGMKDATDAAARGFSAIGKLGGPVIRQAHSIGKAPAATEPELPEIDLDALMKRAGKVQDFKQMNLKNFTLEGPGFERVHLQDVRAKGVESRLDTMAGYLRDRPQGSTVME